MYMYALIIIRVLTLCEVHCLHNIIVGKLQLRF